MLAVGLLGGGRGHGLLLVEEEDVAEMAQLALPYEAYAILTQRAFEPVVLVVVVEHTQILAGIAVQAVFEFYLVEEHIVVALLHVDVGAGRYLAAHVDTEAVVPQTLGELEVVVGVHAARCVGVVDAHAEVESHRAHRLASHVVDFVLEERRQGVVHRKLVGVAVGEIHARGEHGHCHLAATLGGERLELVADGHVVRGVDNELEAQIVERLGELDTTVEVYGTTAAALAYGGLDALGSGDVQLRVHGVARELDVAAVLYGKGLERDDRERVFHLAAVGREASRQAHVALLRKAHGEVAATFKVHIVLPVFTQTAAEACKRRWPCSPRACM